MFQCVLVMLCWCLRTDVRVEQQVGGAALVTDPSPQPGLKWWDHPSRTQVLRTVMWSVWSHTFSEEPESFRSWRQNSALPVKASSYSCVNTSSSAPTVRASGRPGDWSGCGHPGRRGEDGGAPPGGSASGVILFSGRVRNDV